MGEYKTQSRALPYKPNPQFQQWKGYQLENRGASALDRCAPTQTTYSYRSSRIPRDELSPEAIREFTDVTRNGFTETNPEFDNGHSFHTTKTSARCSHYKWSNYIINPQDGVRCDRWGPLTPVMSDEYGYVGKFPDVPHLSDSEISKYGAGAIAKTSPTNANANLTTTLAELVEGLPRIAGHTLVARDGGILQGLGSEYLNGAFGIMPTISDFQSIAQSVIHSTRLIKQYKRDSGKLVRRRYSFPREHTSTLTEGVQNSRYPVDGYDVWSDGLWFEPGTNTNPAVSKHSKVTRDIWFAGAFTYHLEADDSVIGKLERFEELANHLLGTRLTLSTLWELTPWSWFGDWLGTLGNVIQASDLLSSDGLVMKYGYLMAHTVQHDTYSMPAGLTFYGKRSTGPISMRLSRETKERVKATPYGFGRNPLDFSVRQWAILGALGLTKAPRILP